MLRHYRRQGVVGQVAEAGWSWLQPVASAISLLASAASEAEASEYPGEAVTPTGDPRDPNPCPPLGGGKEGLGSHSTRPDGVLHGRGGGPGCAATA